MDKSKRYLQSKIQSKFCQELMNVINDEVIENINNATQYDYSVPNYTSIRNYIIILRKELNKLSNLLSDTSR